MRGMWVLLTALVFAAPALAARDDQMVTRPEIRPFVGTYVPTGDQRDLLRNAVLTGGQVGLEVADRMHVIGTLAWSPQKVKGFATRNRLNFYQYDVGAEVFNSTNLTGDWLIRPFLGLGVGARTYDPRDVNAKSKTYPAGYAALGSEFQMSKVAIRIEARDYLSKFEGVIVNKKNSTRNDLMLTAGLAYHIW